MSLPVIPFGSVSSIVGRGVSVLHLQDVDTSPRCLASMSSLFHLWVKNYSRLGHLLINRYDSDLINILVPLYPNEEGQEQRFIDYAISWSRDFMPLLIQQLYTVPEIPDSVAITTSLLDCIMPNEAGLYVLNRDIPSSLRQIMEPLRVLTSFRTEFFCGQCELDQFQTFSHFLFSRDALPRDNLLVKRICVCGNELTSISDSCWSVNQQTLFLRGEADPHSPNTITSGDLLSYFDDLLYPFSRHPVAIGIDHNVIFRLEFISLLIRTGGEARAFSKFSLHRFGNSWIILDPAMENQGATFHVSRVVNNRLQIDFGEVIELINQMSGIPDPFVSGSVLDIVYSRVGPHSESNIFARPDDDRYDPYMIEDFDMRSNSDISDQRISDEMDQNNHGQPNGYGNMNGHPEGDNDLPDNLGHEVIDISD